MSRSSMKQNNAIKHIVMSATPICALLGLTLCLSVLSADAQTLAPEQKLLREIFQELVEINTTDSTGDTTKAAAAMAARLKAGGIPADGIKVIVPPDAPKKGNLVARLRGSGAKRPLLLLAHIDVVEANRADWQRDPFKLVEENGYFYARGAADNKAMASSLVSLLIQLKQEGYRSNRDIIVALTADEEIIPSKYNGVEYLLKNHHSLIDAELALNEGGSGRIDRNGKYLFHSMQAGEKVFQTYRLEVTNPGGHSAQPVKDNAIYHLAEGLTRLAKFDFPVKITDVPRAYFARMAELESGQLATDMKAILREPPDSQALVRITAVPHYNALLRTTCVATMLDAGHATNALPQRARAVVNCRVLPGESVAEVQKTLASVLANEKIALTPDGAAVLSPASPLTPGIMGPVAEISAQMWPGIPIVPTMSAGATDSRFLNNSGIPAYGISGQFHEAEGNGVHGLNERLRAKSLYEGREFLLRLVKALSSSQ
jgi:acetylornithine deacetylase/succinyl-diaminopimelate desuccinylase-like protein